MPTNCPAVSWPPLARCPLTKNQHVARGVASWRADYSGRKLTHVVVIEAIPVVAMPRTCRVMPTDNHTKMVHARDQIVRPGLFGTLSHEFRKVKAVQRQLDGQTDFVTSEHTLHHVCCVAIMAKALESNHQELGCNRNPLLSNRILVLLAAIAVSLVGARHVLLSHMQADAVVDATDPALARSCLRHRVHMLQWAPLT